MRFKKFATAVARLSFGEQIGFFRSKMGNLIPTERWDDIKREAHDTGFMVAGAVKADLLSDLSKAVDAAIADGETLEQFRARFGKIVDQHGWAYRGERNWRTRVIYQTNVATSYSAGRLKQLRDPDLLAFKPFWMYRHSDAVLTPRPLHVSWDGLTLSPDDPWWNAHYPPNEWGCMCYVVAVSVKDVTRMGGRFGAAPNDGIGPTGTPNGVGIGWDYMPGDTVTSTAKAVTRKGLGLPEPIRKQLLADIAAIRARRAR